MDGMISGEMGELMDERIGGLMGGLVGRWKDWWVAS